MSKTYTVLLKDRGRWQYPYAQDADSASQAAETRVGRLGEPRNFDSALVIRATSDGVITAEEYAIMANTGYTLERVG